MKIGIVTALLCSSFLAHAAIPKLEEKDFNSLIETAANQQLSMNERWQSLVRAGQIVQPQQIAKIQQFAKSNEWFMRNASLIALEAVNSSYANDQAKQLLQDKALVVRSAAVKMLAKKNSLENRQLLAAELAKPYNFSRQKSLWIRAQIMEQIANTATADDRHLLARYLFDSDTNVAAVSAKALEKISSVQFTGADQVKKWQAYVKKNNWL